MKCHHLSVSLKWYESSRVAFVFFSQRKVSSEFRGKLLDCRWRFERELGAGRVSPGRGRSLNEFVRGAGWVFEVLESSAWIKPPSWYEMRYLLGRMQCINSPMIPPHFWGNYWSGAGGGGESFIWAQQDLIWEGAVKMCLSPKPSLPSLQRDYSCGPADTLGGWQSWWAMIFSYISWGDVVLSQRRNQRQYAQASIRDGSPQDGEKKAVGRTIWIA